MPPSNASSIAASWARATRSSQRRSLRLSPQGLGAELVQRDDAAQERQAAVAQPDRVRARMHAGARLRQGVVVARDAVRPDAGLSLHRPVRRAARAARGARAAPGSRARAPSSRSPSPSSPSAWSVGSPSHQLIPISRALVDGGHQQPQLDRQQLDVEQVDLDVARDHDALVEHPLEDVGEVGLALRAPGKPRVAAAPIGAELIAARPRRAGSDARACSRAGRRGRRAARRRSPSRRWCSGSARARRRRR